jgi:hypothetical protein
MARRRDERGEIGPACFAPPSRWASKGWSQSIASGAAAKDWIKIKNCSHPAMEREDDGNQESCA